MGRKSNLWSTIVTIIIILISITIPVAVVALFLNTGNIGQEVRWAYSLPHMNAVINAMTTVILIAGYIYIKTGNIRIHRYCMTAAFVLGVMFLISYLYFHYTVPTTIFGDSNKDGLLAIEEANRIGPLRLIYLAILLSHILLAAIVVPFVLFTLYFALSDKIDRHKQVVKFTMPVWLYVSVTGLFVYWLVNPYYPG